MKTLLAVLTLATVLPSYAGLYTVDPMICRGKLLPNTRVHESYTELLQRFVSFSSTRRNGTLAPSLEVSNVYGNPGQVISATADGQEVWQLKPLRLNGNKVTHPDFVGELQLTIVSSKTVGGKRTDTLRGNWIQSGSVVGGHGYELNCTANVVKTPSRVDDMTCRSGNNCQ